MKPQSIILKGDDQRVKTMEVHNLLGRNKPTRSSDAAHPDASAHEPAPCETRVEVLRVDDQVRGIEVHCSCGEVTVVELTYPSQSAQ